VKSTLRRACPSPKRHLGHVVNLLACARDTPGMLNMLWLLLTCFSSAFRSRRGLALENLALHQQLAALRRSCRRPRRQDKDRLLWVWLSRTLG
jgi:hypothetical protein